MPLSRCASLFALLALTLAGGFVDGARAALPVAPAGSYVPGELLVRFRSKPQAAVVGRAAALGMNEVRSGTAGSVKLLRLPAYLNVPNALAQLRGDPGVVYAEPNYLRRPLEVIPNDPLFAEQWGLQNTGQANFVTGGPAGTPGGDLHLPQAWDLDGDGTPDHVGNGSVTVAIIDDGFAISQPDLMANFVAGYNFVNNNSDPTPTSSDKSHGTEVAGCIGAVGNNGLGVAGAAWNVKLMPLKFGFDIASEVEAMEYARTHGAKVVNLSFGGPEYSQTEHDEIQKLGEAGILVVAAAGNAYADNDQSKAGYPAGYDLPNLLAVAATNRQDEIASFSSYGPIGVDVAAPGLQIITTTLGNGYTPQPGVSGSSFSTGYVSGIAALLRMYHPADSAAAIRARLLQGADPGANANQYTAGGRVNAARSLTLAPQPALRIDKVTFNDAPPDGNGDGALDAGETVTLQITLQNLWQMASTVSGTLSLPAAYGSVLSSAQSFGNIGSCAANTCPTATASFSVQLASSLTGYHNLPFTLTLSAAGGYTAVRHFIEPLGTLQDGVIQTQAIGTTLQDNFQTWHFTLTSLPPGTDTLSFQVQADNDEDLLVSYAKPAQYDISLGSRRDDPDAFYFTDAPDRMIGTTPGGNEYVNIHNPQPGTYYVTVLDYDLKENASYTVRAWTNQGGIGGYPSSTVAGKGKDSGQSGGAWGPASLLVLLLLGILRGRRAPGEPR